MVRDVAGDDEGEVAVAGRSLQVLDGVEVRGVVDVQVRESEQTHDRRLARRERAGCAQCCCMDD